MTLRRATKARKPRERRMKLERAVLEKVRCLWCQRPVLRDAVRRTVSHSAPACDSWLVAARQNTTPWAMLVTQ